MSEKYQSREDRRKKLSNQNKKGKKKSAGLWKKVFLSIVIIGLIGVIAGGVTVAMILKDTPKLDEKLLKDPVSSKILDKNGEVVTELGAVIRDYVEYDDIPKLMEDAVLATEDVRFYKHHGIDFIRLGGAVIANFTNGFGSEGASTITQQVVKNSFLTTQKTLTRKIQEAWLAYQLEQKYTKEKIFEIYVNKNLMGKNLHGIKTAAHIYFGKELEELTLPEAAVIAGLPQSPNNYNPFYYPERAEKRRNIVLTLMHQHGYISKEEMEAAKKVPIESTLVKEEDREQDDNPYESFVDAVIDEVNNQGDYDIYSDGLTIHTTLDPDAQSYVENILNTDDVIEYPDDEFQAGIVLLDTKTGAVSAIGGGRNQKGKRPFNYAIDTKRQPGSTIKPILDYGPAIEFLQWGTYHTLDDKPTKYSGNSTTQPKNWDKQYMGPMTMREALARSRNTTAIQTLQQVGTENAKEFAQNLGLPLEEVYESYAIGGLETGVSPLQMAGAYSAFGNNGFYTEPYTVSKIELRDGTEINTKPEMQVVMKDYTAFLITDMLKSVVKESYGTGGRANVPRLHIAGKTGTTNYSDDEMQKYNVPRGAVPDAWFAGYTPDYTAAIWTGYKNRKKYIPSGNDQRIAQYLFKNIMEYVSKDIESTDFTVPKSVEKVQIEKGTFPAKLASPFTPKDQILYEWAVKGKAPKETSTKFDKVDIPGNFIATYDPTMNEIKLTWDYPLTGTVESPIDFEVSASLDDGADQILETTKEKGLLVTKPVVGGIYTFKVVAIRGELRSEPAVVMIEIPNPIDLGGGNDENLNDDGNNNGTGENPNNGETDGTDPNDDDTGSNND
ncbi:transglycosylase domain-containing protein [Bacillus sp. CGMCC 1.16607]|uniref:transglycosylase domain-containing protein n=1 Tax=Bacillus sp. CGMCC 1.16607 TaxID=3351842 RepID=UPI00363E7811